MLLAFAAWLLGSAAGLGFLAKYAAKPGPAPVVPVAWPAESRIPRETAAATLLLFLHPRCPCSRATLNELERALARTQDIPRIRALLYRPQSVGPDWAQTSLRRRAEDLWPGSVIEDIEGVEARRFGAVTSGHTMLFSADGALGFEGGVTGSRGHEGDNAGRAALVAILGGRPPALRSAPVFGCPLHAPACFGASGAEAAFNSDCCGEER